MKLWIFSDLHLEMFPLERPLDIPDADVCVVAGDILNKGILPSLQWLQDYVGRYMPVVFVAGNHEFYRASVVEGLIAASKFGSEGGVHFLEDQTVEIGGVIFCGATLWTDFNFFGDDLLLEGMREALSSMNDYRIVNYRDNPYAPLRPPHRLVSILEDVADVMIGVYAVWPASGHLLPRVRHVVDVLVHEGKSGGLG